MVKKEEKKKKESPVDIKKILGLRLGDVVKKSNYAEIMEQVDVYRFNLERSKK